MANNEDDNKDNKIVDFTKYKKKKDNENRKDTVVVCVTALLLIAGFVGGGIYLRYKLNSKEAEEVAENTASAPTAAQTVDTGYSWWTDRDTTEGVMIATAANATEEKQYEVGSRVLFGTYSQGENGEIESIAWQVLDKDDDYVLLVSEYVLDARAYSTDGVIQWENSEIRSWLNGEFYEQAFSGSEKENIACFEIENEDNPTYNTSGGHDTDDYVFLLSLEDVQDYSDTLTKLCKSTPYAETKGITVGLNNYTTYWLRSPGSSDIIDDEPGYAATIDSNGSVKYYGNDSTYTNIGIRPAIWVKIGE